MYEDLIEKLRNNSSGFVSGDTVREAADAIEELSDYVRQIEDLRKEGYYLQKTKMMTYGQATMTMPLPKPPKEE